MGSVNARGGRMIDLRVKCDKPYDLDAMDKRKGKPRRKRKDSHTTAYELTIRLSKEQVSLVGKKKYVRVAYARNKRDDLARQCKVFEEEVSARLREAAIESGQGVADETDSVSKVVRAYLKSREKAVVSRYTEDGMDLAKRYIDPTIGAVPFGELTVAQVEDALERIPELSRRLNEEKRRGQEDARVSKKARQRAGEDSSRTHYEEFKPVRVAGRPTQHKVLSLLKLSGNYAVDRGIVEYNVANNKRLSSQYPKSKPLIDNFTEDEARLVHTRIQELPLSSRKVEFQLLFMCGLRPCELLSLTFDDINLRDEDRGVLRVVKRLKTKNASRNIPLDPATTSLLREWRRSRVDFAKEIGVKFSNSWLVCCDDGQKTVYNTLKQRWAYFLKSCGLEHRRPYSMRHTFATLNGRNNVDVKTLASIMGHATAGFTLNVYAGYLESASLPVVSGYLDFLEDDETKD